MIKYICRKLTENISKEEEIKTIIVSGIRRNFGGLNKQFIEEFKNKKQIKCNSMLTEITFPSTIECIQENLKENEENDHARNLMILTNNFDATYNFLIEEMKGKKYKFFIGSDFPQDIENESAYTIIKKNYFMY
eukprot:TRINITY_DN2064_c0_g2_i1.p7 TRINITY_DN2064_c0_g2~~TRINITY_DN2064_c0_g2_i1.p7  ORF type:complete len:134 (+),score=32.38 TRINITY_DN2064_c0_g2_i1:1638-2039(+)